MKRIFLIATVSFIAHLSSAQFTANLVLSPNPPGTLMDWADRKETLSVIVVNQSGAPGRFVVKAEFKLTDGTVIGSVDLARAKIFTLQGASLLLNAADVLPLNLLSFSGKYKTSLDKTGKLPAGTYQLCVRLVTPGSFQPVSEERCRIFTIASFQLAVPIMPFNEQVLKPEAAQTAITFRWAPVAPAPSTPVTYRLLVFEVLDNQTPMQALRSNQPLLNKDVIGTTQYIWQPQMGMINGGSGINNGKKKDTTKRITAGDPDLDGDIDPTDGNVKKDTTKRITAGDPDLDGDVDPTDGNVKKDTTRRITAGDPDLDGDVDPTDYKKRKDFDKKLTTGKPGHSPGARTFIWTLQCLDNLGRPISDGNINGDGISEPIIFYVGKEVDKLKEEIKKPN